jgi:hypothetical protein
VLVFEISSSDFFTLRMRGKPAFPATKELFDFIFADPIVFFVIEDGQQDVEML